MHAPEQAKQSVYLPAVMLEEIQQEASQQDRSLSWLVRRAWRLARGELSRFPPAGVKVEEASYSAVESPHCRQSFYFPSDMLEEVRREAHRQRRPISWVIQQAWQVARDEIGARKAAGF